jgi:hypothetical protein
MVVGIAGPNFSWKAVQSHAMKQLEERFVETIKGLDPSDILVLARKPYLGIAAECRNGERRITALAPVTTDLKGSTLTRVYFEDESVNVWLHNHRVHDIIFRRETDFSNIVNAYRLLVDLSDSLVGYWDGEDREIGKLVHWTTQAGKPFYNLHT